MAIAFEGPVVPGVVDLADIFQPLITWVPRINIAVTVVGISGFLLCLNRAGGRTTESDYPSEAYAGCDVARDPRCRMQSKAADMSDPKAQNPLGLIQKLSAHVPPGGMDCSSL